MHLRTQLQGVGSTFILVRPLKKELPELAPIILYNFHPLLNLCSSWCPIPSYIIAATCSMCNTGVNHNSCEECVSASCGWCSYDPNCVEGGEAQLTSTYALKVTGAIVLYQKLLICSRECVKMIV